MKKFKVQLSGHVECTAEVEVEAETEEEARDAALQLGTDMHADWSPDCCIAEQIQTNEVEEING